MTKTQVKALLHCASAIIGVLIAMGWIPVEWLPAVTGITGLALNTPGKEPEGE